MRSRIGGILLAASLGLPATAWAQFEITVTKHEYGYELRLQEEDTVLAVSIDTLEQYLVRRLAPDDSLNAADHELLETLREFVRVEPNPSSGIVDADSVDSIHIEIRQGNPPVCPCPPRN